MSIFSDSGKKYDPEKHGKSSNFRFGLNTGYISEFGVKTITTNDGMELEVISLEFKKDLSDERGINATWFLIPTFFSDDQMKEAKNYYEALMTSLLHLASAVVSKDKFDKFKEIVGKEIASKVTGEKTELNAYITDATIEIKIVAKHISNVVNKYKDKRYDFFLQYQWNIREGQSRKFLEIPKPKQIKKYVTFTEHIEPVGEWHEKRTEAKLWYEDDEGNIHPITRDDWFLRSKFAEQEIIDQPEGMDNNGSILSDDSNDDMFGDSTDEISFL